MSQTNHKIGIIGSGPAGWTAAIYTSRANIDTTVFLGIQPGGQLTTTTEIENFPGFPEGIQGGDLMQNMQKQAERFGTKSVFSVIKSLENKSHEGKPKFTISDGSNNHEYNALIIASGASARYLGIPGEEKFVGKGYHSCATCDGFFYRGKTIAIVGGGDSAMEEANFLTKFADKVYLIHRSESFRASKIMLDRAKNNPKIEFVLNKKVIDFLGQEKVQGVTIEDTQNGEVTEIELSGVFVAIGHIPNSSFAQNQLTMDEVGYLTPQLRMPAEIRTSKYDTMSNVEGIFLAGDVEDKIYRQAITAAGHGCKAAMDLEKWLEE
ncbi:MAG: thioredoxin-disulfide reductase [Patescibacteria group bacterium]